jgi:hypothetical protein
VRLLCVAGPVRQSARARKPVNYSMDPVRDGAAAEEEEGEEGEVKKGKGRRRKNKKKAGSDEDR